MAEISMNKARTMIRKALVKGRDLDLKPLSVIVLDGGGASKRLNVKMMQRPDVLPSRTARPTGL